MDNNELIDTISKAMRTAWQLGQTYWRQADSDFTSDHRRSDETQRKYDALVQETIAALSRSQDAPRCQCCGYLVTESEHRGCLRSAERSQDVARVALNDEQRRDIQECIDYLTPAAKDFSDLGMVGMGDSKHARCIRVLRSLLAPQPPQAGANLPCPICRGIEGCDHTVPERSRAATLAPAPAEPKGEQQDDYEAKGTIEHLDLDNHRLRRAMQKIMARLAELLDEDQFANIESIVKGVGVEPPEQRAATLSPQQIEEIMEQAQVFASAWSLVGGVFDHGDALETAEQEKANMRALLATIYGVPNE